MTRRCIPITVRGVTYPSRAECARALGLSESAVKSAFIYGYEDRLGMGRGRGRKPRPHVLTRRGWALFVPVRAERGEARDA